MLIDWFTVGAQALNFLVLVWLLKRVLYQPVMAAIEARETKVSAQLADAAAQNAKAQHEMAEFKAKNEDIDRQRVRLLSDAAAQAANEGKRLLDEAKAAADALRVERQATLQADAKSLNQALGLRVQQQVFSIARRTLADLASVSLEERSADRFCQRLRTMDGEAKAQLRVALTTAAVPTRISSAFELPPAQRAAIQAALNETFAAAIDLRFEITPDVITGIELTAGGCRVSWSIDAYLADLEQSLQAMIAPAAQQPAALAAA